MKRSVQTRFIYRRSFLFVLPAVTILGGFGLLVSVTNIWYSLLEWNVLTPPKFVGFANYIKLFTDQVGVRSILNTLYYAALYVLPTLALALLVAMALNKRSPIMSFFRVVYYIPVVTSYVVVLLVWNWIYDYDVGLLNYWLTRIGLRPMPWLLSPAMALPSLVLISIWKNMGYSVIIFLAGLQNIDGSLYDAAQIDGCGSWKLFWNITLPQLRPTIVFALVLATTASFQMFVQPYLLTRGGPNYSTSTFAYYFYRQAFSAYNVGYGGAIAVAAIALFFIIITLERAIISRE